MGYVPPTYIQDIVDWIVWHELNPKQGPPTAEQFRARFPDVPLSVWTRNVDVAMDAIHAAQNANLLPDDAPLRQALGVRRQPSAGVTGRVRVDFQDAAGNTYTRMATVQLTWGMTAGDARQAALDAATQLVSKSDARSITATFGLGLLFDRGT